MKYFTIDAAAVVIACIIEAIIAFFHYLSLSCGLFIVLFTIIHYKRVKRDKI
jgi:hypothetical protein